VFEEFAGRRVLLLQGPIGPFFAIIARKLQRLGATVLKVNLNAADAWFFSGAPTVSFRGSFDEWRQFVRRQCDEHAIDTLFVFGDSRRYHAAAIEVANERGIDVRVFEEGYLRPNYITFERGGTNFNTTIPLDAEFYNQLELPEIRRPRSVGNTFWWEAAYGIIYAIILTYFSKDYPHYEHHRDLRATHHAPLWWLSVGRKLYYSVKEAGLTKRMIEHGGGFFLAPLQVHDDFQVKNSRFDDVKDFIDEVTDSFAKHAPKDCWLVFKHHPKDRGFRDYTAYVRQVGERCGLTGRIFYVHDLHLPTLLKSARGCVVINSTVGLSSLYHRTAVKCLDRSVYEMFTSKLPLDEFWSSPGKVNRSGVEAYIRWLALNVQINGTFYRPSFWRHAERDGDWRVRKEASRPG